VGQAPQAVTSEDEVRSDRCTDPPRLRAFSFAVRVGVLLTLAVPRSSSAQDRAQQTPEPAAIAQPAAPAQPAASAIEGAAPDEPPEYREFVLAAIREHRAGHLEEARALFAKAHALFPNARTYRALGVMALDLKNYREAAGLFQQALSATVRPLDVELRASSETLLKRARTFISRLSLALTPATTKLRVDGEESELQDGSLLLELGNHTLEFHAPGYHSQQRALPVRGGEELRLRVSLLPIVDDQRAARAQSTSGGKPKPADGERPLVRNPWLWAAVSAVVVGAAVATGVLVQRDAPYERGSSGVLIGAAP
jgi:hypothetical protein